ncbi:OadG family protein [Saccharospirillum mangrovi]|uniref:OadG family protein n=1 Tax=Saccharospirillum mangrovi TaxID=2161747 RepID=UPI000D3AC1A4|nr:OadG family protein [Saccharospirillum mangrovi]
MSDLMMSGFELMLLGMGTVFVFLTVLVIGTSAMSRLIMLVPGTPEPEPKRSNRANRDDLSEVAAVAAAVKAVHGR